MKFLVDNQLPPALAQYLQKRGFDCEHVLDVGLAHSLDQDIIKMRTKILFTELQNIRNNQNETR